MGGTSSLSISNLSLSIIALPGRLASAARLTPACLLVDRLRPTSFSCSTTPQASWIDALELALYATLGLALMACFFSWISCEEAYCHEYQQRATVGNILLDLWL